MRLPLPQALQRREQAREESGQRLPAAASSLTRSSTAA